MTLTDEHRKKLVQIAVNQIGVHEEGGNNKGKMIQEFQSSTWLDGTGWPWCAAFVDWCILQWQKACPDLPKFERPQTAGAFDLERWAESQNLKIIDPQDRPTAGDIVIYDFNGHGHCGIIEEVLTPNQFLAVEGNTNKDGLRDGDGVWSKIRNSSLVRCYIHWEFNE